MNKLTPLQITPRLRLKNRVVVPPMASETATQDGFATDTTVEHYRKLASSGAGLVWVEYTYVHPSGRSEPNQLGAHTDAHVTGLMRIADAIRAQGARPGLQLTHAGAKAERALTDGSLHSPSGIPAPVKGKEMEQPDIVGLQEIQLWKKSFVAAARRAQQAGFELVELHSAHGYGLNQWLSPYTNRRETGYGGSTQQRARLLIEIIHAIRQAVPALAIAARIPGQDHLDGGLTSREMIQVAQALQQAGLNLLDVSSGLGGWRRPRDRDGEGYLVPDARLIAPHVSIPVIAVGGIKTGAYIDAGLARGDFALAAVGRAILEAPEAWGRQNGVA